MGFLCFIASTRLGTIASIFLRCAFALLLNILFSPMICFGQRAESFTNLTDDLVKKEIASFNLKSVDGTFPKVPLKEIPLFYCANNEVLFTSGKSTFIHIYASAFDSSIHTMSNINHPELRVLIDNGISWGVGANVPERQVDSLFVVLHSHFKVKFPASVFRGLYEPHFCSIEKKKRKTERLESVYNKVFQSEDKRRVYIYMLNGEGANRYEVTWVIQDGKYHTRVIDHVR